MKETENTRAYIVRLGEEAKEVITGPGGFRSELKDLLIVGELLRYRIAAEWPRLTEWFSAISGIMP